MNDMPRIMIIEVESPAPQPQPQPFFISPFKFNQELMIIHPVTGGDTGGRCFYVGVQASLFDDANAQREAHVSISKPGDSGYHGNCAIPFNQLRSLGSKST